MLQNGRIIIDIKIYSIYNMVKNTIWGRFMEYERLHKNSKISWLLTRLFITIITGAIFFVVRIALERITTNAGTPEYRIIGEVVMGVILVLLVLNTFIYPFFEYKQWRYIITEDKVEFTEGIFFSKKVTIPIVRVQHIQINQGPLNRILKLADVVIYTAGGQHKVPNIHINKADEIGDYLKNKIRNKVEANV